MEKRGDPIPGSLLVRDFCKGCGEPIRVNESDLTAGFFTEEGKLVTIVDKANFCEKCRPHKLAGHNKEVLYQDDPSPWEENNIRILEDMGGYCG